MLEIIPTANKSSMSHGNMMLHAVLYCVSYQRLLVINLKEPIKNYAAKRITAKCFNTD